MKKFTLLIVAILMSSCTEKDGHRIDTAFYAMETAKMTPDGFWAYEEGSTHYDDVRPCLLSESEASKIPIPTIETNAPNQAVEWLVYIGQPKRGVAYGFLEENPQRQVSHRNGKWFTLAPGSIEKIKEVFDEACMKADF